MERINKGHTNKVFKDGDKIIIEKNLTGFNHKIKYDSLKDFDFVPELLSDNTEKQEWRHIEGDTLNKPSYEDLAQLAKMLREVHKSELKLPKNNMRQRVNNYLKTIHDKGIHVNAIEDNWKYMMRLLSKMNQLNPVHNDVWNENLIKDKDNKIWLIDWEYATMGDKHFDLAFYIESQYLSEDEENVFLNSYNATEKFQAYIPQWMDRYKLLVNWITLAWAYAQDKMPFPIEKVEERVNQLSKKLYK